MTDEKPTKAAKLGLDGHDEPVVVDNGPASVLFGLHDMTQSVGETTWLRPCMDLQWLLLQEQAANGRITWLKAWKLAGITRILVTMKESAEFFEFVPAASPPTIALTSGTKLERDQTTGRLTFGSSAPAVTVAAVEGFDANNARRFVHKVDTGAAHVKISIIPAPAPDHEPDSKRAGAEA